LSEAAPERAGRGVKILRVLDHSIALHSGYTLSHAGDPVQSLPDTGPGASIDAVRGMKLWYRKRHMKPRSCGREVPAFAMMTEEAIYHGATALLSEHSEVENDSCIRGNGVCRDVQYNQDGIIGVISVHGRIPAGADSDMHGGSRHPREAGHLAGANAA